MECVIARAQITPIIRISSKTGLPVGLAHLRGDFDVFCRKVTFKIACKALTDDHRVPTRMITQIRNAMGWNQDELADKLGSNQSTVSRWEKGASIPSPEKQQLIEKIAAVANIASIDGSRGLDVLKMVDPKLR
jgi:DNA-binding transcriptional regulator YiaG